MQLPLRLSESFGAVEGTTWLEPRSVGTDSMRSQDSVGRTRCVLGSLEQEANDQVLVELRGIKGKTE